MLGISYVKIFSNRPQLIILLKEYVILFLIYILQTLYTVKKYIHVVLKITPHFRFFCCILQAIALPKQPVPPLERTLEKYEKTLQPLLSEASRERLKALIQKFGGPGGLGPKLQLYLLQRQQKLDNWVSVLDIN